LTRGIVVATNDLIAPAVKVFTKLLPIKPDAAVTKVMANRKDKTPFIKLE